VPAPQNFISEVRNCTNKEQERARVDKELANIRTKFKQGARISNYQKKKYCWKLLYIYMLGYEVEFGHMEAVSLVSSDNFPEKQVGYMVTTVLLNESHEFIRLVINSIQKDLNSRNEDFQCLALNAISNLGGREFAEALAADVMKTLCNSSCRPVVRKKAALCLLRLYRKNPDAVLADAWAPKMFSLLDERDLGVLLSLMTLLCALASNDPEGYELCQSKAVRVMERLTAAQPDVLPEYTFYGIPSPWLQVKTLRALQYFGSPEDPLVREGLLRVLERIVNSDAEHKNVNKSNAVQSVLIEAVALAMHVNAPHDLLSKSVQMLGRSVGVQEANVRYVGLDQLGRLSSVPEVQDLMRGEQAKIVSALKDSDISIRRRALDLMYAICDQTNSRQILKELLGYLSTADFSIREDLAVKIAILAERFAESLRYYVEVVAELVDKAGEFVSDDICHRVVQIVTNNPDLQVFASRVLYDRLCAGSSHETFVKLTAHVLGEFGGQLVSAGTASLPDLFHQLHERFPAAGPLTKALMLSAYMKMLANGGASDATLKAEIEGVFEQHRDVGDAELQQRAVEYLQLSRRGAEVPTVLAAMPKFPERESILLKRIRERQEASEDANVPLSKGRNSSYEGDAAAASSAGRVGDLMGGLDLLEAPAAAPASNGATGSNDVGAVHDLLGSGSGEVTDPFASAAPVSAGPGSIEVRPVGGTVDGWLNKLYVADKGILYQDQFLQIGVKSEYRQNQGRLMLFFGNKHSGTLESCSCVASPTPSYRLQLGALQAAIPAQTQVQVPLAVSCVQPSVENAEVHVKYTVGGQQVSVSLVLPVAVTKFLTPVTEMDGPTFFAKWKSIPGPPSNLKIQDMKQTAAPLEADTVKTIFTGLQLGVCSGLAPENNVVGIGQFYSEAGMSGLAMVRFEIDPQSKMQFRVTVASEHPVITSAVRDMILKQL